MMRTVKKALYKVPNGKLLKIFLEDVDGKITAIQITGDFFVYPEESIEKLEQELLGTPLSAEALSTKMNEFLKQHPTTLFGVDVESLVSTILQASAIKI